ncbi:MAG: primosomal protein N' [Coriobacteriales bacterium]|jgi:primosomal protein N' (replication factor Y)|nr:primosomal protein N' [Coriobacteriales bacterium]
MKEEAPPLFASVVLDIPTRSLDEAFTYAVPEHLRPSCAVGCSVLLTFARRTALGYVVALSASLPDGLAADKIRDLREVLSTPYFDAQHYELARWISREYLSPLSETLRLFTPPGSAPRLQKDPSGVWRLEHPGVGPVDDRWVSLTEAGREALDDTKALPSRAKRQRAILEALREGELKVSELALAVEQPTAPLRSLEKKALVSIENRRRIRGQRPALPVSQDILDLTAGQREALAAIFASLGGLDGTPRPILLDGVTGSGKTEVYLQAIRHVLEQGGSAIVLVPEISLTPQTVARFRSRFGEQVAVLHSRLSIGERFDQWDLLRNGSARVVVGARSALFAPLQNLGLIIIDEEHESSYKQGSTPRYLSRDVAEQLAKLNAATLVLGSATPSLESLEACREGRYQRILLPERTTGRPLPSIKVVNLAREFKAGNKTMFSDALTRALLKAMEAGEKAVLLLNKRGFASFLLCRDCGYVPMCENCATSLTYHEHPPRLVCHHCDARQQVPPVCPECGSPYLRQLGPGTQFAYDQLLKILPEGTPVVRMDADTTRGRYGHEKCLEEFIAADHGVLLGTQMIAKGLDFPEVTLVGVLIADTALKLPDFRAAERTYQLLEQVAGRAGRAEKDGRVIVQTYWPEHPAINAAAEHDRDILLDEERELRGELGYPPFKRLANVLIWGESLEAVREQADVWGQVLRAKLSAVQYSTQYSTQHTDFPAASLISWQLLGPSPCVIAKRQGQHRWHLLLKAPVGADLPSFLGEAITKVKPRPGISQTIDIDPYDLM